MQVELDHIGFVVNNIENAIEYFVGNFGYNLRSKAMYDELRHVKLAMLELNGLCLELIQPLDASSPSYDFMLSGGGLHHLCYATDDLEAKIKELQNNKHTLIKRAECAPLLSGKKVAFLFSRETKQIIELVEN